MSGMQQFKNVVINGGNFSQVQYGGGRDEGLHILRQHIAADAMFDSAERFPPAKCHPGTRERIIKTIMEWINDPTPAEQALWLHGPAGTGKSAIAHSIAVLLQESAAKSKYAGSFFFARDAIGRGDGTYLFSTIAYQLAINFPSLRVLIDAALLDNPTLPTKSIDVQLQCLIIEPLKRASDWPTHNPTVIIDGLDECSGSKRMQSTILTYISNAILEHQIPLRFLIVSRPEYWIAGAFELGPLGRVTRLLSLGDDGDVNGDIHNYLRDGFDKIYDENIWMMSSIPRPWPSYQVIDRLVEAACGQFVYASTVLNFVGGSSDFCDPQEQLRILTTPGPQQASAFSDLDNLYITILSAYPRLESLQCVLGGIMIFATERTIQELLGLGTKETQLVLRALSSLIKISELPTRDENPCIELEPIFGSPYEPRISLRHLSFQEFLEDKSRSGKYAIDQQAIRTRLIYAVLKIGKDILQGSPRIEETVSHMGLSAFRRMLYKFSSMYLSCDPAVLTIHMLNDLDQGLKKLLAENPSQIPHASHALWFSTASSILLSGFTKRSLKFGGIEDNNYQALFKSVLDGIERVRSISAKQLLHRSRMTTATFTFLASHCVLSTFEWKKIGRISKLMSVDDREVISDLHHLRDFIYLEASIGAGVPDYSFGIVTTGGVFRDELYTLSEDNPGRQLITAWDDRRLSLCAKSFKQMLGSKHGSDEFLEGCWYAINFLQYSRLADIHSKEYFEDENKMTIFKLILDSSFWDYITYRDYSDSLVLAALSWFNRQLTAEKIIIISEHDNGIPQRMRRAAKMVFEKGILPHFLIGRYSPTLVMMPDDETDCTMHSLSLQMVPPGHGKACSIVQQRVADPLKLLQGTIYFQRDVALFEDEVMTDSSVISRSDWYPHLAASLLVMSVKHQYGMMNEDYEYNWSKRNMALRIPQYLIRSLPYAIPSLQNLNAIRALHYLYNKTDPQRRWGPPYDFCSLAIEFLKKYDSAILSSSEFNTLETWLSTMSSLQAKEPLENEITP